MKRGVRGRMVGVAAGLAGAMVVGGCAERASIGMEMGPRERAVVAVMGSGTRVAVENEGPGVVEISFPGEAASAAADTTVERVLRSSGEVVLETKEQRASVRVRTRGAKGLKMNWHAGQ